MSNELRQLTERLERLERQNKNLKRWSAIAGGALLGLGLFGFAAPVVCDVVTGERLVIRDASGRQRFGLDAYHVEQPGITLHDGAGRTRAKLGLDEKGDATLAFFDEKGNAKASYLFAANGAPKAEEAPTGEKRVDPSMARSD